MIAKFLLRLADISKNAMMFFTVVYFFMWLFNDNTDRVELVISTAFCIMLFAAVLGFLFYPFDDKK